MPKPIRRKKKFIDIKNERTATFSVIHRSQKDPLAADDEAPQRLLQVIRESVPDSSDQKDDKNDKKSDTNEKKEEERKFGIFYDDDYNYIQHVKDREMPEYDFSEMDRFLLDAPKDIKSSDKQAGGEKKLNQKLKGTKKGMTHNITNALPSCVFGTEGKEEKVGLLNKAAPTGLSDLLDWDPDIVETLDDNFNHEVVFTLKDEKKENESDEDLEQFLAGASDESDDEYEDVEDDIDSYFGSGGRSSEDEENDKLGELDGRKQFMFENEETRSRFTAYSMSSSVVTRNDQLRLVDDKFEEFMAEYDDENVGGLELDEIEGVKTENSETMRHIVGEYQKILAQARQKPLEPNKDSIPNILESFENMDEKAEIDLLEVEDSDKKKEKWDCESILSTYSNLYNRPKLLTENRIRVCGKTGIPKDILGKPGLTESALKKLNRLNAEADTILLRAKGGSETDDDSDSPDDDDRQTITSRISAMSFRNKHETPEEKKERKTTLKALKRERRGEKKANTAAFKEEKRIQEKRDMCNQRDAQLVGGKRIV